jgi:hypothetical protein
MSGSLTPPWPPQPHSEPSRPVLIIRISGNQDSPLAKEDSAPCPKPSPQRRPNPILKCRDRPRDSRTKLAQQHHSYGMTRDTAGGETEPTSRARGGFIGLRYLDRNRPRACHASPFEETAVYVRSGSMEVGTRVHEARNLQFVLRQDAIARSHHFEFGAAHEQHGWIPAWRGNCCRIYGEEVPGIPS